MAKIKFKMSIEKFAFEYEGDQEKAEKLQSGINNFFGSLAETQNQIIDVDARRIEPKNLISDSAGNSTSPKKHKRRAKKSSSGSASGDASDESSAESTRSSRSNKPLRPLLVRLIQDNFFSERRPVGAIREELAKKGHNFESRGIATGLLMLTRDEYLERDNSSGNWEYWKGRVDVPAGS